MIPASDIQDPIEVGKVPGETFQDQETDMVRNKKKAAEKQEAAKSSWPSIRSFFPTVTPARWQTQTIQTALEPAFPPHPPSDEFDASQDFWFQLGDVDMADVPDRATKPDPDEAHDERVVADLSVCSTDNFSTPPATPPLRLGRSDISTEPTTDYPNLDMADALYVQKPDSVLLAPPALPNRKRSLAETTLPSLSRKVSRECETHQSPRLYNVNTLLPIRSEASRSFDSSTSAALSFISTSTHATTPSTSFTTETSCPSIQSSATSFDVTPVPFAGRRYRQDDRPTLDRHERGGNYGFADPTNVEQPSLGETTNPFKPVSPTRNYSASRTAGTEDRLATLLSIGPFGNCVYALESLVYNVDHSRLL